VNFYKRHLGDYAKDTTHLSLLEHGIYTRLLDVYYSREKPFPGFDATARLIGARSDDERSALRDILNEFFTHVDGGYQHARCEREIAEAGVKAEKNREVGKLGGRPRKTETGEVLEKTIMVSDGNHPGSKNNPSQTPEAISQTPEARKERERTRAPAGTRLSTRLSLGAMPDEFLEFCRQERRDLDPSATWERFRDYWQAKPGKDGVKLDWLATWRNWVRGERVQPAPRAGPAAGKYSAVIAGLTGRAPPAPTQEFIDVESSTVANRLG